jgi:UDP-N-acetylmuramoyl-tripeptide--D-alanyl-D-alanine ligase
MKNIIQKLLTFAAKKIIEKHQPKIVAITGSVGKTSTRNAIATVLEDQYRVRTNIENYNNEFGVPLTIIGEKSPGRSVFGWLRLIWKAKLLYLFGDKQYPNMLVLEFGADRPGDIEHLCRIACPDISVLTAISPVHVEFFNGLEGLKKEKGTILEFAKEFAIVNADDREIMDIVSRLQPRVADLSHMVQKCDSFGINNGDVHAENIRVETRDDFSFEPGEEFSAIHFDLAFKNQTLPAVLNNLLGMGQVSSALAAAAVASHLGMSAEEIISKLAELKGQAGRMRPIAGIKGSLLLDDSYNAAPASMRFAIQELARFSLADNTRRIVALGSMGELGDLSEQEHRLIGLQLGEIGADLIVTVGEKVKDIRSGAIEAGIPESQTHHFETSVEAGRFLDGEVNKGDIVLIKGSQSARMEKVAKDLMAEPNRASELLVRQYGKWVVDY